MVHIPCHYSSSINAFLDSVMVGKSGNVSGHLGDSTPYILRRIFARWSSGDHFNGAAAFAVASHCGQSRCSVQAPQLLQCCNNCLAMLLPASYCLRESRFQSLKVAACPPFSSITLMIEPVTSTHKSSAVLKSGAFNTSLYSGAPS